MVETALVLPVLLVLVATVVGLGHILFARLVVAMAAGQAAREAAVVYASPALDEAEKERRVRRAAESVLADHLGNQGYRIDIHPGDGDVRVTVRYPYRVFIPGLADFIPGGRLDLEGTAVYPLPIQ